MSKPQVAQLYSTFVDGLFLITTDGRLFKKKTGDVWVEQKLEESKEWKKK